MNIFKRTGHVLKINDSVCVKIDYLIIVTAAVILRVIFLSMVLNQIDSNTIKSLSTDSGFYVGAAEDMINGTDTGELGTFTFGPGFPFALSLVFRLFGTGIFPFVFIQIAISALSCVVIYKIADLLFRSRAIALSSGILAAFSYTSITLSIALLSDTLFFFIFSLAIYLFIKGFSAKHNLWYFPGSGILFGYAFLCRTIAQFWPIMLFIIPLLLMKTRSNNPELQVDRKAFKNSMSAIIIMIVFVVGLVGRNYIIHGVPTTSFASANGFVRLVNKVIEDNPDYISDNFWRQKREEFDSTNGGKTSLGRDYIFYTSSAISLIKSYPTETIKAYFSLMWQNINEINYYHRWLLPDFKSTTISYEYKYKVYYLNYALFVLSMLGFILLLLKKKYAQFTILISIYIYFVALIGFGRWQGSRIFYPSQIASLITVSYLFYSFYEYTYRLMLILRNTLKNNNGN